MCRPLPFSEAPFGHGGGGGEGRASQEEDGGEGHAVEAEGGGLVHSEDAVGIVYKIRIKFNFPEKNSCFLFFFHPVVCSSLATCAPASPSPRAASS